MARRKRKCMFCPKSRRVAQPRGLPLCRKHGGYHAISKARRARHRRKVEYGMSQSNWEAHVRNVARAKKAWSFVAGPKV
jgi:hypothetical protein